MHLWRYKKMEIPWVPIPVQHQNQSNNSIEMTCPLLRRKRFARRMMTKPESLSPHALPIEQTYQLTFNQLQKLVSRLAILGVDTPPEDLNVKFLRSLPSEWDTHVAPSSKVQTAPNCASHSDEIICSFFAQQASMPITHDDEDLLQIDEDAME
ncbi:hypothetical protein Tco_0945364 [Tanacetum coccineum]